MKKSIKLNIFNSPKIFFFLNSFYYLIQLSTFFYISSIALPEDLGISSYVISFAGIFAVLARYGMPVFLVEGVNSGPSSIDEYYKTATAFSFTAAALLIPFSFFIIINNTFNSEFIYLMLIGTLLMLLINPLSMIIEQLIILKKQTKYLSINCIIKTFIFPLSASLAYLITNNLAVALIFSNISILLSPIIIYSLFEKRHINIALKFLQFARFNEIFLKAFPYFINSLALILILSIDKIFVGNIFSVEVLGSYDLMWKLAILVDFLIMQPLNSIFSRDILDLSKSHGFLISMIISSFAVLIVVFISFLNIDFIFNIWIIFFDKYEFNSEILKLSISFFILMFAVNQLRNLMANIKLRKMCTISSCIIPLPLIYFVATAEVNNLNLIPTFILIGVSISLIFNLVIYNYFNFKLKRNATKKT